MEIKSGEKSEREESEREESEREESEREESEREKSERKKTKIKELLLKLGEVKSIKAKVDGNIEKLVKSGQSITSSHRGMNLATQRRFASEAISGLEAELDNLVE
jgi:hypothetical protein